MAVIFKGQEQHKPPHLPLGQLFASGIGRAPIPALQPAEQS